MSVPTTVPVRKNEAKASPSLKNGAGKRKAKNGIEMPVKTIERPTRERLRRNGGLVRDDEPVGPKSRVMIERWRARYECLLDFYRALGAASPHGRRGISEDEWKAGVQYREAYLFQVEGIKTMDSTIERIGVATQASKYEKKRGAEKILNEAHKEAGLSHAQIAVIVRVCGHDEPVNKDMRVLRSALDRLARFWNFI